MHHLSFRRKEEGGLGTRIPSFDLLFESNWIFFRSYGRFGGSRFQVPVAPPPPMIVSWQIRTAGPAIGRRT
jgi:hypothetical protein